MKVIAHAHTTFSNDGELSPQQLADLAESRGFHAVLMSDHFESLTADRFYRLVEECESIKNCLMVPGYERSWRGYHVLAFGVDQWFDDRDLGAWANDVKGAGGITVMAHPTRYRHRIPEDILSICDAIEVWNSKPGYDGSSAPNPRGYRLLGTDRYPMCGQDIHGLRHVTSVAVELKRTCSSGPQIIDCLKRGEYLMTNDFLHFGTVLPGHVRGILATFHACRSVAVGCAIKAWPTLGKLKRGISRTLQAK
jgi:hypothetical protein